MWLVACFQPPIVREIKWDKYLSCTDGEFSLFLWLPCFLGLPYVYYSMHGRDWLYWCTTKTLCVSPFIRKEYSPLFLPLFLCPCFWCRFSFNEEKLGYMNGCYSGFRPSMGTEEERKLENLQGSDTFVCWTIRKGYFEKQKDIDIVDVSAMHSSL